MDLTIVALIQLDHFFRLQSHLLTLRPRLKELQALEKHLTKAQLRFSQICPLTQSKAKHHLRRFD